MILDSKYTTLIMLIILMHKILINQFLICMTDAIADLMFSKFEIPPIISQIYLTIHYFIEANTNFIKLI